VGKDSKEYLSFEEALEELQVDEEELKKMVSDEEIRAFRDGGKLKFKVDEVLRVKEKREEQPTIILPTEEATALPDEKDSAESPTVVEIETPEEMPTAIDETPSETLATEEAPAGEELVPTMQMGALGADDIGLKEEEEEIISPLDETAGIGLADEPATVTEEVDAEPATAIGDEDFGIGIADEEEVPVGAPAEDMEFEEEELPMAAAVPVEPYVPVHPAYVALLIVGILVLIFAGIILIDIVRMPDEIPPYLRGISDFILDKFSVK
jgi:hypothetical protein